MVKGWFFGDSFTDGHGSAPRDEYYKFVNGDTVRWSDLVCNSLGLIQENYGLRGASNENIFENIQSCYSSINSGDFVFLQCSSPTRQFFFLKDHDVMFKYGSNKMNTDKDRIELWLDPPYKTIDVSADLSDEQHEAICKFMAYIRLDAKEQYLNYYRKQFNFYRTIFINKGCKVVYWDWEEWRNYETIKDVTNNLVDDLHWSKKGNADFAQYILTKLNF